MSELVPREETPAELARRVEIAPGGRRRTDLAAWAGEARQAYQIAVQLAETAFVPKAMQRKPGEVTGAILAGRELGLEPMASLAAIDVIEGTPTLSAIALRGLIQHHGHEVWIEESTEHRAVVCGRRKGSTHIARSVWTIDRARRAGLVNKKNWREHPTAMLVNRATAEVARQIIADVLLGMPYTAEELADVAVEVATDGGEETPPRRRRARRDPVAPAEPAGEAAPPADEAATVDGAWPPVAGAEQGDGAPADRDDTAEAIDNLRAGGFEVTVVDADVVDEPSAPSATSDAAGTVEPDAMTDAQRRRLGVAFRQAGISDRSSKLDYVEGVIGRRVQSSSELTVREASAVIDALISKAHGGRDAG